MSAPAPSVLSVLVAARELIAKPRGWTTGEYARSEDGTALRFWDEEAVCFCTMGALNRTVWVAGPMTLAMHRLQEASGADNMVDWNDARYRTQADVVAVFDKAIEAERSEVDS